jgi:antitoxin MazE
MAIRLPASVVKALELHEGDDIEVLIAEERVFQVKKKPGNDAILARLRQFRGKLPADFKFDRDDANARV